MITEFQDGFITKTKLNELVGGINANSEELVDINARILTADVTKTVGVGGDFTTLNLAIDWCKTLIPMSFKVTITIKSATIFYDENIQLYNVDLSFVTINMENNEILQIQLSSDSPSYKYFVNAQDSVTPYLNVGGIKYIGAYEGGGIALRNSKCKTGYLFNSIEFVESGFWIYDNSELICDDEVSIKQFSYRAVSVTNSRLICDNISSGISAISNRVNPAHPQSVFSIINSDVDAHLVHNFGENIYNSTTAITQKFKLFEIIRSKVTYISSWNSNNLTMAKIIDISEGSCVGYELLVGSSSNASLRIDINVSSGSSLYHKYLSGGSYEGYIRNSYLVTQTMSNASILMADGGTFEVSRGGIMRIDGYLNSPNISQTVNTTTANGIIFH